MTDEVGTMRVSNDVSTIRMSGWDTDATHSIAGSHLLTQMGIDLTTLTRGGGSRLRCRLSVNAAKSQPVFGGVHEAIDHCAIVAGMRVKVINPIRKTARFRRAPQIPVIL